MINYRLAKEDDYKNINDFHNRIYKENRTIEQFRWEFHDAPEGASIYIIAEDADKVIGTQCAIPIMLINSAGEKIFSGKSEDTLVDPDYRGKNIFNNLYDILFKECSVAGMKVIWGFTSAIKPFIKMGFEIPYNHRQVLAVNKVCKSYHHLASLNKKNNATDKFKIFGLCCLSKSRLLFKSKNPKFGDYIVGSEPVLNVEELLKSNLDGCQDSFAIEQSEAFQKWRVYNDPNYYKLQTFTLRNENKKLVGVFVVNSTPEKVAFVVQSMFHYNVPNEIKSKFITTVTSSLFADGVIAIRNWVFDHNSYNLQDIENFLDSNYYMVNKGVSLVWKRLDGFEIDPKGFFLSRIATQGVL